MSPDQREQTCSNPASPKPAPRPTVGQPFNPHREACGFYPPDIVARNPDLTDGQKRLYERGVRWAGRNGRFWYSFETMASELGKSPRQVKRDLAALEGYRLIIHKRRGKRQSNIYRFLYHSMFDGEVTSVSHHPGSEVTYSPSEVTSTSPGDVTSVTRESYKKNFIRESSTEEVSSGANSVTEQVIDDDHPPFEEKKDTSALRDSDAQIVLQVVDLQVVNAAAFELGNEGGDPLLGTGALPERFLNAAADRIHASKCFLGLSDVNLSRHGRPDLSFTAKIAEPWRGKGTLAFLDWVCSTIERQLGSKGKSSGQFVYGLFLADSKASARNWDPNVPMSEAVSRHIAFQKHLAAERKSEERRQALMNALMPVAQAAQILTSGVTPTHGDHVLRALNDPAFLWLMEMRTNQITPADLSRAASEWRRCRKCTFGLVGSAVKGTLAFCECEIGQQKRADQGDDYISQEVGSANANIRSKLARACRELRLDFMGDAIERMENTVIEHEGAVEIRLAAEWEICSEHDLQQALGYLNDKRAARVIRAKNHAQPGPASPPPKPPPVFKPITQEDVDRICAELQRPAPKKPVKDESLDGRLGASPGSPQRGDLAG